jgi:phosphoglucomutase
MVISERAGRPADPTTLVDVDGLVRAYYERVPDPGVQGERVAFGTSGHRGSSLAGSFNEAHIVATTAAIVAFRQAQGTGGPLFMGRDTHALSEPAFMTALEVLHAADVDVRIDHLEGFTPTPAISHAILTWNREHPDALADGIVVTPSHNPPADGGFKYDPPSGGPADSATTTAIQDAANALLAGGLATVPGAAASAPGRPRSGTTSSAVTWTTCRRSSTWRPSPPRACGSASIPSVARASRTGARSPTGMRCRSSSRTSRSIPGSGS